MEGSNSFLSSFFSVRNLSSNFDRPKIHFFAHFGDFGVSPRAFLVKILGFGVPFWLKIRGKSENRDFVKIVLPPRREHHFGGSDPPKIDLECDFERRWCKKSMTNASGAILGSAFFAPGRFFVDFGLPLGSQNNPFGPTFGRLSWFFGVLLGHMWFFCAPGCSGRVPGAISGVWGPSREGFWEEFG